MDRLRADAAIFLLGALGYGAVETLWRGGTHWTMLLTGGVCFLLIYLNATRLRCSFSLDEAIPSSPITWLYLR